MHVSRKIAYAGEKPPLISVIHQQAPLNFDYQATTPCDPEVLEAMAPYWKDFWGNASSRQNSDGLYASAALSVAREKLASSLKIKPE